MGFDGKMEITTLEGVTQHVSQGPAAAIIPIKQLGTNGGGYYGVNSSHPLETLHIFLIWWNAAPSCFCRWPWYLLLVSM